MDVVSMIGDTLYTIAGMFWQIFWALVLGFGLSGMVQTFIPKHRMAQVMGDDRPASIARAGFFGAISSSCSYAAAAMSRSVFLRGAHISAAVVFMIAATNLVIELGFVLWSLMGWQFVVAEFVGGVVLIAIMALVRKFMVMDMETIDPWQIASLAAAVLALGGCYWLVRHANRMKDASDD